MKQFKRLLAPIALSRAAAATPAGAENVLRWASATEPLTFDPRGR